MWLPKAAAGAVAIVVALVPAPLLGQIDYRLGIEPKQPPSIRFPD